MWPIGPEPFVSIDTYHYYRSLAKLANESDAAGRSTMNQDSNSDAGKYGSLGLLGYRLVWMFVGPMTATILALMIVMDGTGWLTTLDLVFLVAVLATISARWASYYSGDLTDGDGESTTTPDQLRSYTYLVTGLAAGVWLVANLFGNHLLARG